MLKVLTVPRSRHWSGMTFTASPACTWVMDTTTGSTGLEVRVTTDWKAWIRWLATSTGSTPRWGMAAWAPLPLTSTSI